MDKSQEAKIIDLVIRMVFLGLFVYSALVMVAPLASVVIWAGILTVALYPLFDWLQTKLGGRKKLATTIMVLVGLAVTLGPIATAISGASNAFAELTDKVQTGSLDVPPIPERLEEMPVVGDKVSEVWSQFDRNLEGAIQKYGPQIIEITKAVVGKIAGVGLGLLALALSVIIMGILLSPGPKIVEHLQVFANRIFEPRGGEFVSLAGATIRNVTKGVIGVAAIQAAVVWVLLAAFGFSSAAPLAFVCMILSIIQLGPGLVLIPAVIIAWSSMSGGAALVFTVLAVPTMIMDSFLRPVFISKGLDTPMLVILIGVIGGMMAYGLVGVFMGPVLFAVFYELFKLWIEDATKGSEATEGASE